MPLSLRPDRKNVAFGEKLAAAAATAAATKKFLIVDNIRKLPMRHCRKIHTSYGNNWNLKCSDRRASEST
jgi:hypothetical protein